ncbi:dihydropteroate synthase [Leuconostoc citreum]|uniref:dihydropteroate synthase n=1 Tax=Leuconostoc citreum TaxID=33964 RepID=UPI000C28C4C2|nr:dihydropteroate synthase [Leuconostoc citreum]
MKIEVCQPESPVLANMQQQGEGVQVVFDEIPESLVVLLSELNAVAISPLVYWVTRGAARELQQRFDVPTLAQWLIQNDYIWQVNQHKLHDEQGIVYAVLNVSPESFYNGDNVADNETMIQRAGLLLAEGADVIEVGGQTTKPGYIESGLELSPTAEIERVAPIILGIKAAFPNALVAIDTYKYEVMVKAVALGVDIVNDVNGFTDDPRKLALLSKTSVGLLTMWNPRVEKVTHLRQEMHDWFATNIRTLVDAGISRQRIALDPGVGYSQNSEVDQDLAMMNTISHLQLFRRPIMTAVANKGWAKFLLELPKGERADVSLIAANEMFHRGARILRVHDAKSAFQMTRVVRGIEKSFWTN